MLTRPLVYKGPTDHLTQYFELDTLFQGIKLLSKDKLMDWQQQKEEKQIQGVFFSQGKLIKTFLAWPLSSETSINTCACQLLETSNPVETGTEEQNNETEQQEPAPCKHIAALAIETKTRLDRLPYSLKQTETFHSEWQYLTDWISRQTFDPYPKMARHRVIYILDGEADNLSLTLHKAYLTQQNEYQKKADLDIGLIAKGKQAKFVSLTDQQIIFQINQLISQHPELSIGNNGLTLYKETPIDTQATNIRSSSLALRQLLKDIILSGRCFWRTSLRSPLIFSQAAKFQSDWWYLNELLFLDRTKNRVVDLNPVFDEKVEAFLEITSQTDSHWLPCLTMSSEQIALVWANQAVEIDVAKVSFRASNEQQTVDISLQKLLAYVYFSSKRNNSVILEAIAQKLHQLDWLSSIHANFEQPISQHFDICDRYLAGNFSHWLPLFRGLELEGWLISFDKSFRLNQKRVDKWYSKISLANKKATKLADSTSSQQLITQKNDWFNLEIGIKVDGKAVNIMPYIVNALHQGLWDLNQSSPNQSGPNQSGSNQASSNQHGQPQNLYLTLDDGTRVELSYQRVKAILDTLLELYDSKPLTKDNLLRLPKNQFSRLTSIQKQTGEDCEWQETEWLKRKAESLSHGQGITKVKVPKNVNATLRKYQQQGLNWLQFLSREDLSGILADDMGLGKTLQTLAHIQSEKNNAKMKGPCIVIAPTTLLGNWFAEASKFTPDLKLVYWAGSNRYASQDKLANADLIITSYGLLLRDADILNRQDLHLIILDEAQAIKNSSSKISKIVFTMSSKHRLCLTGTPLENHLGELWSLFHFLMPGFLGDESQFKRLFRIPIEKEHDVIRQKELADRIAPFMLRRTKDKVAKDLPAKTIIEELIDLDETQADVYESVRLSMFEEVQKAVANSGSGKNQLLIGNALLRLRQVCCHPNLINKSLNNKSQFFAETGETQQFQQADLFDQPTAVFDSIKIKTIKAKKSKRHFSTVGSAKLTWLKTTLPEMIENGRKILIFSSFTSMLSIIEELLADLSISYLSLTGKTRNRSELVNQFQTGNIPVFLISLKAGGSGLNLTEADTVIHFDPWWNPAAENQASDRAHRIGQEKPVFVYKLITKGTVEERINLMQMQKSQLAQELYMRNEKQSRVERPDWVSLLAPLEYEQD